MKLILCVLLVCLGAVVQCQETALEQPFTGTWSTDFGVLSLCTVENKIYGGFETGYLEGVLQPDRRTLVGNVYYAGNTPDSLPRGFRLSIGITNQTNNTFIYGFVQSGPSSYSVSYLQISSASPSSIDCRVPSFEPTATIAGSWKAIVDGEEVELNICFTDNGFSFEASSSMGMYFRGPVLSQGGSGAGTLFSNLSPDTPFSYGGALFRTISRNATGGVKPYDLMMTMYSSDIGLVMSHGCDSESLLSCLEVRFIYADAESPGTCSSQASLAIWSGYWTFSAANGQLVTRVVGNKVFGNFLFGTFEGTIDARDPLLVSGIYFTASWTTNGFGKDGNREVNYFGTFRIQMAPDYQSFSGTIWSNYGQTDGCASGGCSRDWRESRLPGYPTDPSAREVNGIDPLLSSDMTTDGVYEYDGNFLDGINKAFYYRCSTLVNDRYKNVGKRDTGRRLRSFGSYTKYGCGTSLGVLRTAVEFGDQSIEPLGTTASEIWTDETGTGAQLVRRISDSTLRVSYFYKNPNEIFPDLSFCPDSLPDGCAGIDSYIFSSAPAKTDDCAYCGNTVDYRSSSSGLYVSVLALFSFLLSIIFL